MRLLRFAPMILAALALTAPLFADTDAPKGTVAFFNLPDCPRDWKPAASAAGRLILTTDDPARVGVQIGTPLGNAEDRTHSHSYKATVKVGKKSITGADSCCNSSAAEAKSYEISSHTAGATTRLPFIQLAVCEKQTAPSAQGLGDALPAGAISFFNLKQCPAGWEVQANGIGRFTVPLVAGAANGGVAGAAIVHGEEPQHKHDFASSIKLAETEFNAVAGCCNDHLASDGTKKFQGVTDEGPSGLPYVALLLCQKKAGANATAPQPPRGTLIYTGLHSCPAGWIQNLTNQGRYVVGLPDKGTPGLAFGGEPLKPLEERMHTHPFSGKVSLKSRDVAVGSGWWSGGYGKKESSNAYSGTTATASSNLPYIQLLQCEKL